jgi:formylglycine-generating enzyme required for sulfatase activity
MGSDTGQRDEQPAAVVWVKRFSIQVYEVTQGEYRRCVEAGSCTARRFPPGSDRGLPVTGVSYSDARAYCAFVGMRLPDEAEWEKAARHVDGRRYPWGDEPDCRMANFGNYDDQGPCAGVNPGRALPGGQRPAGASAFGVHDMAGNVWEWVKPTAGLGRASVPHGWALLKGGSATSVFILPRSSNRLVLPVDYRDADIGFRCAADAGMKLDAGHL